ncbi:MAG TPA: hypothetical protein VG937_02230 [Polyangiaceae bacterium]|nr:hypothetical protein [Polyangiaceae bacterium]
MDCEGDGPGEVYCGSILVTDTATDAVFRVNATTGVRTVVSDSATPVGLPNFAYNYGIAIQHAPSILVHGPIRGSAPSGGAPTVTQK